MIIGSTVIGRIFLYKKIRISTSLLCIMILLSLYLPIFQYFKYYSLHNYADFTHWLQLIYNISLNWKPFSLNQTIDVVGTINYLSVHFVPFIYCFAIIYKILPYIETIIIMNFLLLVSSIIPLFKLSIVNKRSEKFALFLGALFVWYLTFQYIILYEFEMLRFSIPIILWMLYFWEIKSLKTFFVFVLLATLVREEVGLTITMFGIYVILIEKRYRLGLATALIGIVAFVIITQAIMPMLRTTPEYRHIAVNSFSAFGSTISEMIISIITHPVLVLKTIIHPIKLANIFMIFLPLLFIPLLSPAVMICTIANLGVLLISDSLTHSSYMLFYVSPSIPFVFYAFIKGWPKFTDLLSRFSSTMRAEKYENRTSVAMGMVISGLLLANVFFGPSPISLQFWFPDLRPAPFKTQNFHYSAYSIKKHHLNAFNFLKYIPESGVISAPQYLHPILYKKKIAMVFPKLISNDGTIKADYVFLDKTNNGLKSQSPAYVTQKEINIIERDKTNWELLHSEDGYYLFKLKTLHPEKKQ